MKNKRWQKLHKIHRSSYCLLYRLPKDKTRRETTKAVAGELRVKPISNEIVNLFMMNGLPTLISRTCAFPILGVLGGIFRVFFFVLILIEHSVSEQWRP